MLLVCRSHCKEQGSPICRPGLLDIFAFFPLQWSPHLPTPVRMAVTTVLPPARPGAFTMETAPSAAPACLVMPETGTGALVSTCGQLSDPESCFGCTSPHPQGLSETFSFVWLTPLGTAGRGGKKKVSFESEAKCDCLGTRLLSEYGCPWRRRAWRNGELLPACSFLFLGASVAQRDARENCIFPWEEVSILQSL